MDDGLFLILMQFKITPRHLIILSFLPIFLFAKKPATQQQEECRSLLWKVSSYGSAKVSYLFGTLHAQDEKLFQFASSFSQAFASTEKLIIEILPDYVSPEHIYPYFMANENYNIRHYLSNKEYKKLDNWLKEKYGWRLSVFDQIKPVFIYMLTSNVMMDRENKPILDEYLYQLAKKQGKEIIGLESIEEQFKALEAIPLREQVQMILQNITRPNKEKREYQKLIRAYLKQDLNQLLLLTKRSMHPSTYRQIIDERNAVMTQRLIALMQEHALFVAVGAGHLPGENGIIALLKKQGFEVTPVK